MLVLSKRCALWMTLVAFVGTSDVQSDFQLKNEYMNRRYNGLSLSELSDVGHHECAKECMSFSLCKSIDYFKPNRTCKINPAASSDISMSQNEIVAGAIFSDISDWPVEIIGSCSSQPCFDNQKCIPVKEAYQCRDIECDSEKRIENGKVHILGRMPMNSSSVECDEGYLPSKESLICQLSGQWEPVSCNPVVFNKAAGRDN